MVFVFEGFGSLVSEEMQFGSSALPLNSTSMPVVAGNDVILLSVCDAEAWAKDRNSGS
jgi:hypothetical protein